MKDEPTLYLDNEAFESAIDSGDRETVWASIALIAQALVAVKQVRKIRGLDPEDVVQEACVEAMTRIGRWERSKGSAFNYVTTSVLFTILSTTRRQLRHLRRFRPLPPGDFSNRNGRRAG